jgi:hypothetical protein
MNLVLVPGKSLHTVIIVKSDYSEPLHITTFLIFKEFMAKYSKREEGDLQPNDPLIFQNVTVISKPNDGTNCAASLGSIRIVANGVELLESKLPGATFIDKVEDTVDHYLGASVILNDRPRISFRTL